MFEQDYIMRLIKEMIRAILKLIFSIDTDSPTTDLLLENQQKESFDQLLDLIDAGNINEAENHLYDLIDTNDRATLGLALLFYSYLNEKEDDFLESHQYSRDEIKEGLKAIISDYGINGVAESFLTE